MSILRRLAVLTLCCVALATVGCKNKPSNRYQGYAEGEFVLVAAPTAGRLEKRWVKRGDTVNTDTPLFALERENELADRREAEARVHTAEARYANLTTGLRSSEVDAVRAELAQAEAALRFSAVQLERNEQLFAKGYIAKSQLDEARTAHARDLEAVAGAQAKLQSARISIGRDKEMAAAKADVDASKAALAQSDWRLAQRAVRATGKAFVQDTFYSEGEWVPAGSPVVSLLPPSNLKLRFFVPEAAIGSLKVGRPVEAVCDGCSSTIQAKISFISSQPEYTPPVIYSREQRAKLVFLVEAIPEPAGAELLHPGQPLDVELK
jgi:HlyD family secretion protein